MDDKSSANTPAISLPKGGGAIKGIGETFQPNLFSGTGNFSVPIYTSPGQNEFGPKLSLQYSTGSGNGPFGLGWQLSIPRIARKTEKGLPKYSDEDVFVMSGAEDLVLSDNQISDSDQPTDYIITRYRPRTEGLFARIEKCVDKTNVAKVYWRVTTKENITSIYGKTLEARIVHPQETYKIFEWLLEETFDTKGNRILYEYVQENPDLKIPCIHEKNRSYTQAYIRRILYGNTPDNLPKGKNLGKIKQGHHYVFETIFDYGDYPKKPESINAFVEKSDPADWPIRKDPFSSFRVGFEIRTLRRCERVLMNHYFKESEVEGAPLVKSTDFSYENDPNTKLSILSSVKVTGYKKNGTKYRFSYMPSVTFKYSEFNPKEQKYKTVKAKGGDLPPEVLINPDFTLFDIHGDGLLDLIGTDPVISGFYEATPDGKWKNFKKFNQMPSFNFADPNVRLVDLTGDGLSDILVTGDNHFLWYKCLGEEGFAEPKLVPRQHNLDVFPDVYFSDPAGRVRLADMTGNGLNDIVLVQEGCIGYWPNLGYGRFGKQITMENAPQQGYNFDPKRFFLVDIDGTGCSDLVYVDFGQVYFWFNQSGNSWSNKQTINGTPVILDLTSIQFADFFGTGTATIVWSYDYGTLPEGNYKLLDFCGGKKPHLLTEMSNNMGTTTRVQYASSTKFYLEDKEKGEPWVTNLPFPVQVLEKTEVIDHISKTKLVTTYKYHHGYYDGREREFRGFGRVDQFDTEEFDIFNGENLHTGDNLVENNNKAFHVPTIETRNWFHTGAYFDEDKVSPSGEFHDHNDVMDAYQNEFYKADDKAFHLQPHDIETDDTPHEAYRALRGTALRTEVYSHDKTDKTNHPYTVTENRYKVILVQPKAANNHAVYLTTQKESVSYHYERNPDDPRVDHDIQLQLPNCMKE